MIEHLAKFCFCIFLSIYGLSHRKQSIEIGVEQTGKRPTSFLVLQCFAKSTKTTLLPLGINESKIPTQNKRQLRVKAVKLIFSDYLSKIDVTLSLYNFEIHF